MREKPTNACSEPCQICGEHPEGQYWYISCERRGVMLVCDECRSVWTGEKVEMTPEEKHEFAKTRGWYDPPKTTIESLALIGCEVSEAIESVREDIPKGERHWLGEELADVVLRVLDICGYLKINLNYEMEKKHEINKTRPWRHGKKC